MEQYLQNNIGVVLMIIQLFILHPVANGQLWLRSCLWLMMDH